MVYYIVGELLYYMLEQLDKEHRLYIIGLLQGDGHLSELSRNRGKLQYEISYRDKNIVDKLHKILSKYVYVGISTRTRDTNFKQAYKSICLSICNKQFRNSLSQFIPMGRKAKTIVPPTESNPEAYIRGLTDADGSMGITSKNRCFWSLATSSEYVKTFVLSHIQQTLNISKKIRRNTRDNIYNICLYNEDAQQYTKLLYGNSSLHIDRKYINYISVQNWKRTIPKRNRQKRWEKWEDIVIISNQLSLTEKTAALNRSKNAIKTRIWRLKTK